MGIDLNKKRLYRTASLYSSGNTGKKGSMLIAVYIKVFVAVIIQILKSWVTTKYILVGGYRRFRGTWCPHLEVLIMKDEERVYLRRQLTGIHFLTLTIG
jgi:hypothetical protein